jgi:hypothetical protein
MLLIAVAALSIASTAHAEGSRGWRLHRTCTVIPTDLDAINDLTLEDALAIQKFIPDLRKRDAFWKCVADRDAGKVKHCYANDRRWR